MDSQNICSELSEEFNNKNGISSNELLQFNTYYSILKGNPFILKVGNILTEFALQKLVINTIKSMNWKGSTDGKSISKVENPSIQYLVHQEEEKFLCPRGFARAFKLTCEHVLSFLSEKTRSNFGLYRGLV